MSAAIKTQLKVLQICPGLEEKKISMNFVRQQAMHLREIGVDVKEIFIEDRTSVQGILRARKLIRAAIRDWQPDILHAQYGTVTAMTALLCAHSPLVITFRGSDLNPDGTSSRFKMGLKILMSQIGARFATRLVAVSEQLRSRLWWAQHKVHIIPSGVDMQRFCAIPRATARERLGWTHDAPVVLFNAGFNHINKRLDLAEEAIKLVQSKIPDATLHVMAGKTPTDEVPLLMNACDALLLLSDFEGSPNVVKEALSCNLPVISFDVGDVAERLAGQPHCKIVPRSASDVAEATIHCLANNVRGDSRSSIERISKEAVALSMLEVYQSALADHS